MAEPTPHLAFGRWLASQRAAANLTQEVAARRIGIGRTTYARWELGEVLPRFANVMAIAEVFRISAGEAAARAGYRSGAEPYTAWAESLARRIDRRAQHLSEDRKRRLEAAIDAVISAADAA